MYTKSRDIHYLGIDFLQMLMGKNVMDEFPDGFQSALGACTFNFRRLVRLSFLTFSSIALISPALQQYVKNLLLPTKKTHISCIGASCRAYGDVLAQPGDTIREIPIAVYRHLWPKNSESLYL